MIRTGGGRPKRRRPSGRLLFALVALGVTLPSAALAGHYVTFPGDYRTLLVSRPSGAHSRHPNGASFDPATSLDAKWIGFASVARNLGASPHRSQVFARAVNSNHTFLISRADGRRGRKANGASTAPAMSGGGKKIAFASSASNLGGRGGEWNVYLRNLYGDSTTLISRAGGKHGARARGNSFDPAIDKSARHIVFTSNASNLPGSIRGVTQIYERNLNTNRTILISRANNGRPGNGDSSNPQISTAGNAVVFQSAATNLGASRRSGTQVYERRTRSGRTILVSTNGKGAMANADAITPSVDGDGLKVAFASRATNLYSPADQVQNIFVKDLRSGAIILNSRTLGNRHGHHDNGPPANGDSFDPSFPRDGRFVCFASVATNLGNYYDGFGENTSVENVYVHDMQNHGTFLISRVSGRYGHGGNGDSSHVVCSAGASLAAYQSKATNLRGYAPARLSRIYRRTIFGGH